MLHENVTRKAWYTKRMSRRMITTVVRLRSKHGRYPAHLHRMGIVDSELCECGERGELEHMILTCNRVKGNKLMNELLPLVKTYPINVDLLCHDLSSIVFKIVYKHIVGENIII
uniref:Uncharacterized protein n=1 Tax=Cacopsylla melanoneura TaxID=428564 RepID=A0A8D8VF21_9HEMI